MPATSVGVSNAAVASVIGLGTALAGGRLMQTWLFDVTPRDPFTFVAASSLVLASAMLAAYLPARRAARMRPLDALRAD